MAYRVLYLSFAAVALTALATTAEPAKEQKDHAHEGHVVKISEGKVTIVDKDKKEHTHEVAPVAEITLDGKNAKLENLKPHMHVKLTLDERRLITKIVARTPEKK